MRKLSPAQLSALKSLEKTNGFTSLYGGMLPTWQALHDRGLVLVTIFTPVRGQVSITKEGTEHLRSLGIPKFNPFEENENG